MVGSGLGDCWVVSCLGSPASEEVGALMVPVFFEPGGFGVFGRVFSVGLRGLSTLGDLPLG
jgi:hypothetical protein